MPSIRHPKLKSLVIEAGLGGGNIQEYKKINCPSLVSFSCRPLPNDQPHFCDGYVWHFPMLKKLKTNRFGSFIRNLKHLEVLLVLNFFTTDMQWLKELPRLKYLDVHHVDDCQSFGSLEEEFGDRVQINYRALPLRYARNRMKSTPSLQKFLGGFWLGDLDEPLHFGREDLELYDGCFEQVGEEVPFYLSFQISDHSRALESSFFAKFVDTRYLHYSDHIYRTLRQDEHRRIIDSFPNLKPKEEEWVPFIM